MKEGVAPFEGCAALGNEPGHAHLALLVPRIALHDAALARTLRSSATAIPVHLAAGSPERLARAHAAAGRVHVMLIVAQSWAYVPADGLADAPRRLARRA
jgi:hypothetical protein